MFIVQATGELFKSDWSGTTKNDMDTFVVEMLFIISTLREVRHPWQPQMVIFLQICLMQAVLLKICLKLTQYWSDGQVDVETDDVYWVSLKKAMFPIW